jgi:hypothetical protein
MAVISIYRPEPLLFLSSSSSVVLKRLSFCSRSFRGEDCIEEENHLKMAA